MVVVSPNSFWSARPETLNPVCEARAPWSAPVFQATRVPMSTAPPTPDGTMAATLMHTSGPLVVGYLLAWGLYGVLAVQVYIYYLAFPNDRVISKSLVVIVFLLETLQVVVIAHDMFQAFAIGFGNPSSITGLHLTGISAPIIGGAVGFIVQLFYAYRIRVLSESNIVPLLVSCLAIVQCVGAIISGVRGFMGKDIQYLDSMMDRVGHGLFNATSAACDLVIAIAMSYYLPKLTVGISTMTPLIRRIVRLVVGSGILTAAVAILDQALFQAFPHKGYFLAPAFVLGKLYSNSMMVIFNCRVDFGPLRNQASISLTTNDIHLTHGGNEGLPVQSINQSECRPSRSVTEIDLEACPQKPSLAGRQDS